MKWPIPKPSTLWAEMFSEGDEGFKVWFYSREPGYRWRPSGWLEWRAARWHASGVGHKVLQALQLGSFKDRYGVIDCSDPKRAMVAIEENFPGPSTPNRQPFATP